MSQAPRSTVVTTIEDIELLLNTHPYLTTNEVAAIFRNTAINITRWCRNGTIPHEHTMKISSGQSGEWRISSQWVANQLNSDTIPHS